MVERPAGSVRWVTAKLLVVGGGKMGSALVTGLIEAGWAPVEELAVSDPDPARRASLSEAHPGLTVVELPVPADAAVLAVKPDVAEAVLRTLAAVGDLPGALDRGRHLLGPAGGRPRARPTWWCGPCPTPPP